MAASWLEVIACYCVRTFIHNFIFMDDINRLSHCIVLGFEASGLDTCMKLWNLQ